MRYRDLCVGQNVICKRSKAIGVIVAINKDRIVCNFGYDQRDVPKDSVNRYIKDTKK